MLSGAREGACSYLRLNSTEGCCLVHRQMTDDLLTNGTSNMPVLSRRALDRGHSLSVPGSVKGCRCSFGDCPRSSTRRGPSLSKRRFKISKSPSSGLPFSLSNARIQAWFLAIRFVNETATRWFIDLRLADTKSRSSSTMEKNEPSDKTGSSSGRRS
jgi:hypothetical protein